MKFLVESKYYKNAEYVCTFKRNNIEYITIKFSNLYNPYLGFITKDIPMKDVIKIFRVKTKFEKKIIKLWNKLIKINLSLK